MSPTDKQTPQYTSDIDSHSGGEDTRHSQGPGNSVASLCATEIVDDDNHHSQKNSVNLSTLILSSRNLSHEFNFKSDLGPLSLADSRDSGLEYQEIAAKLFNEDFVSIQPEEYTQFLAGTDEESTKIRDCYMDLFSWNENLLVSTRLLCSKLYLKGESQELDRILSSFTKAYLRQNPKNLFCTNNFEKIYILIYSLILLNTALHNPEVSKKSKISQADYIKNSFTTFIEEGSGSEKQLSIKQRILIEKELSNYYDSLLRNELYLKQPGKPDTSFAHDGTQTRSVSQQKSADYSRNSVHQDTLDADVTTASNGSDDYGLTRKVSASSIWSIDNSDARRPSLSMSRLTSTTSSVTLINVHNTSGANSKRVGFGRALASGGDQSFYKNGNGSRVSLISSTPRHRESMDFRNHTLNKRTSISSLISKESSNSFADDTLSVLTFDTVKMNNLKLDDDQQADDSNQIFQIEDFNVNDYQDQYDLTLELQGSPYLKEGLLKLKILNNDLQDNSSASEASSNSASTSSSGGVGSRFMSFFGRGQTSNASLQRSGNSLGTSQNSLVQKFTENFVVVSKGELSLYSFDPKVIKKHQQKMKKIKEKQAYRVREEVEDPDAAVGDGNWLKNAANIGTYNLCSTYAQMEKTVTTHGHKQYLWSLTFPTVSKRKPKKFIFEAGTNEIALEFVNTCNFWAAKITAIPALEESVSSIEYGWGNLDGLIANRAQFKKSKTISKWEPIPKGIYLSHYIVANGMNNSADHSGMMKQFVKTFKYYNNLRRLYYEFIDLQNKFTTGLPQKTYYCSNYSKVMSNYTAKISEYKGELIKYKNYLVILGFGLQLRFDLEEHDKILHEDFEQENEIEDDDLTKLVKSEIYKLFSTLKDVGKIIPTFEQSKSINDLVAMSNSLKELTNTKDVAAMVKSPKSFALVDFQDTERHINELIPGSDTNMSNSHSTTTITEEEEPEDIEISKLENDDVNQKTWSRVEGVH